MTAEVQFEEYDGYFVYDGVTYPTVTLSNGSVWMAKNLSYLPDGYTPSADGTDPEAHILYPYELVNDGGTPSAINASSAKALTDAESIEEKGYLYDAYAIFGVDEITSENIHSFEGAQGISASREHRASALRAGMCRQGLSILLFADFPTRMIQAPRPATRSMRTLSSMTRHMEEEG